MLRFSASTELDVNVLIALLDKSVSLVAVGEASEEQLALICGRTRRSSMTTPIASRHSSISAA